MGTRGRKSTADLKAVGNIPSIERPEPPAHLTDDQKEVWRSVVSEAPPSEFSRDRWPMLESYCVHTTTRRRCDKVINEIEAQEEPDTQEWKRVCEIRGKESGLINQLGIRLNIAQSTAYERRKSGGKAKKAPWQT